MALNNGQVTCSHCGTANDDGRSYCIQCNSPLTAYAGQLTGEASNPNAARQIAQLTHRPPVVYAMSAYLALSALLWAVVPVFRAFATREKVREDGMNYLSGAFSSIGPVFKAIAFLPVALALCFLAWAAFAQREWAWLVCRFVVKLCFLYALLQYSPLGIVWGILGVGIVIFWYRAETKAWFGQN